MECQVLTLTGHLREEFGSTPVAGEDVVLILHDDYEDDDRGAGGGHRARGLDRATGRSGSAVRPDDGPVLKDLE